MRFLWKLVSNKIDLGILTRIVMSYSSTRTYLFKMRVSDSPTCRWRNKSKSNHIFWACPLTNSEESAMYKTFRKLKLVDIFSVESYWKFK